MPEYTVTYVQMLAIPKQVSVTAESPDAARIAVQSNPPTVTGNDLSAAEPIGSYTRNVTGVQPEQ